MYRDHKFYLTNINKLCYRPHKEKKTNELILYPPGLILEHEIHMCSVQLRFGMITKESNHNCFRYASGQNHLTDFIGMEPSKKRKRRTSFTPQALELLNAHFERNTHPSGKFILPAFPLGITGHCCHAGPVRIANFTRTIELFRKRCMFSFTVKARGKFQLV